MNTKTLNPALVAVQMQEWPDSVILTDPEMLNLLHNAYPEYLKGAISEIRQDKTLDKSLGVHEAMYKMQRVDTEVQQTKAQWARSAFLCRMDWPDGFFYACGKREGSDTYAHIGFRFGTEPCEYMSGFGGMTYTPNQGDQA